MGSKLVYIMNNEIIISHITENRTRAYLYCNLCSLYNSRRQINSSHGGSISYDKFEAGPRVLNTNYPNEIGISQNVTFNGRIVTADPCVGSPITTSFTNPN